ncbi:MAG: D-alanyl-D-alanine carboxypeptidase, partial [Acidobacteriota bacterium]
MKKVNSQWAGMLAAALIWGVLFSAPQTAARASGDFVERVSRQLEQLFADPAFVRGVWGVQVKSLDNGEVLYQKNAYKYLMPASNMKLPTAAAAHRALGLDFRYRTVVSAQGKIAGGTLRGDLLITGSGDPTLGARLSSPDPEDLSQGDPLQIFRAWAVQLKQKGIRKIQGDLVGDAGIFDPLPLG